MKQNFLKAVEDTIRITVYGNNRALIPTSATITLYSTTGGVLQGEAAATVDASTGEMTYTLTTAHTASTGLNFKAVWKYVYNGSTYYQTQLFDVVKSLLAIPITDDDLYDELESLRKLNVQEKGTATAGTSSTLTDTAKRKEDSDYWTGGTIEIVAGTGIGQRREISDFVQSTSTFTVSPVWATTPDSTSVYVCVRSFTKKIQVGFDTISTMLYDKGKRHNLILESSQIAKPLVYLVLHMIALDLADETDDKWDRLSKLYYDKFDKAFNNMKLDYDEDESGSIDEQEKQQSQTSFRIGRA